MTDWARWPILALAALLLISGGAEAHATGGTWGSGLIAVGCLTLGVWLALEVARTVRDWRRHDDDQGDPGDAEQ